MAVGLWLVDVGMWLSFYDPDFPGDGRYPCGDAAVTTDVTLALRFTDAAAALAEWARTSTVCPTRPDGRPNRPLTGHTVEVRRLPLAH